jgi:hypothetical protein
LSSTHFSEIFRDDDAQEKGRIEVADATQKAQRVIFLEEAVPEKETCEEENLVHSK